MTIQEMMGMGIDPGDLIAESDQVGQQISQAGVAYGKAKIASEKAIQPLRAKINTVNNSVESPIDYNKSKIKALPISADSMKMNVQYFSHDQNSQSSSTHASTVSSFVSDSLSEFGQNYSGKASVAAQNQVNSQHSRHSIAGTLVIAITCTHKNAQVFAPYIMDVDKAVHSWNAMFPSNMIKTNDLMSIAMIEAKSDTKDDPSFKILSGATYGSSFVGMVHVLNTTDSSSSQSMESIASEIQGSFQVGGWFAEETGGFGVSSSFSDSAKNLLSTQNISSHATLITMGIIPSIKSNQVKMAVDSFSNFSPADAMENLAKMQNSTAGADDTVASKADKAKAGQQAITMSNMKVEATLSGVAKIDDGQNKIIDTNSMMTAMDDYVNRCVSGGDNVGVPINYYLKDITQSEIARSWMAKYYPNKYNKAGSADDSSSSDGSSDAGAGS